MGCSQSTPDKKEAPKAPPKKVEIKKKEEIIIKEKVYVDNCVCDVSQCLCCCECSKKCDYTFGLKKCCEMEKKCCHRAEDSCFRFCAHENEVADHFCVCLGKTLTCNHCACCCAKEIIIVKETKVVEKKTVAKPEVKPAAKPAVKTAAKPVAKKQ